MLLLAPRSSRFTGLAFQLAGVACMGLGAWTALAPPEDLPPSFIAFVFAMGVLMREVGKVLTPDRGGAWVDQSARRLEIQGTGPEDILRIDANTIAGIRHTTRVYSPSEDAAIIEELEVLLNDGSVVLLGESPDEAPLLELATRASEALQIPILPAGELASPGTPPSTQEHFHFRVHRRWALATPLAWMGLVSTWLGIALMTQGMVAPILGIILASPIAVLGCVLMLHGLARRLGSEEIQVTAESVEVRFRFMGRVMTRRSLSREQPLWARMRPGAARGARLEIATLDGTMSAAGGVHAQSGSLNLTGLTDLVARVNASLTGIPSASIAVLENAPLDPR